MKKYQMCIDGEWCDSSDGSTSPAVNPAKDEAFGTIPLGTRDDARRAIAAARRAQPALAALGVWKRAALCLKIAEALEKRREEHARMLCTELGKPYFTEALEEADKVPVYYRQAAEHAKWLEGSTMNAEDVKKRVVTFRRPRGVYAVLTPSNFPTAIASQYIAAAIATGNSVAWCPALTAAASCTLLMEAILEAGLPVGSVNLVTGRGGEVGDELISNPGTHGVGMTGGTEVGRKIAERAAGKPLLMELGGNGPTIVFEDADIAAAAPRIFEAATFHAGQICCATERVLVHESRRQELIDAVLRLLAGIRMGDPFDRTTTMGPMTNLPGIEKMKRHIADATAKGAKILFGGKQPPNLSRYFFEPTLMVDFTRDSLVNLEESFGPIVPIASFRSEEEAWEISNACSLGLTSSIWTRDLTRAWKWAERLPTGITVVNDYSFYWEIHIPFGGIASSSGTVRSGLGRLGGKYTMLEMTEVKTIAFNLG
jgi:succinate-semialdehyde dehydrogenase/glutarate-semialdehyde dehydrogenase